jgi:hypothetical protein
MRPIKKAATDPANRSPHAEQFRLRPHTRPTDLQGRVSPRGVALRGHWIRQGLMEFETGYTAGRLHRQDQLRQRDSRLDIPVVPCREY